jgi:DNA-binding transcriptional ArsR family regulator
MAMRSLTALADPSRRRIVELLAAGELAAGEIAGHFTASAPAVSQHLKVLREAGLIRMRVDRQRRIYALDPDGFRELEDWLARLRRFWASRLDALERRIREREQPTASGEEER